MKRINQYLLNNLDTNVNLNLNKNVVNKVNKKLNKKQTNNSLLLAFKYVVILCVAFAET